MLWLKKLFSHSSMNARNPAEEADLELLAPVSGTVLSLDDVPDPVICERIAGDGCAFIPEGNTIKAPCDGMLVRLLPSNTAFCIKSKLGPEIYVRFGIGTDYFSGEGFEAVKKTGDEVKAGDDIITFDLSQAAPAFMTTATSMIALKSSAAIARVTVSSGKALAGQTGCMWIFLKKDEAKAD